MAVKTQYIRGNLNASLRLMHMKTVFRGELKKHGMQYRYINESNTNRRFFSANAPRVFFERQKECVAMLLLAHVCDKWPYVRCRTEIF